MRTESFSPVTTKVKLSQKREDAKKIIMIMNEKNLNFIGQNVRKWRIAQKLTQEQLALRSDLSQSYINQLESGKKGFSRDSLIRISEALGIPASSIFKESGPIKNVRSYDKKTGRKGPVIEYVIMKPEPYEKRREKRKLLRKKLSELVKKLPADVVDHYVHLMKMEVSAFKKKGT